MIHPILRDPNPTDGARSPESRLEEAVGLAAAIDLDVVHAEAVKVNRPQPGTLLGSGTVEHFAELIHQAEEDEHPIDLVVMDHALSPVQQRNLERALETKVIDRTGLILEIFGARARTREGQLQVELAALSYQRSRLVRSWTHLERQRGGFGFLGLGAQPPTPEWGTMLASAREFVSRAWWVVTFPGLAILITVLAFNLLGDGLRDALDPKLKR